MSEIVKTEQQQIAKVDTKEVAKYLNLYGFSDIPQQEKELFTELCIMNGLNPFKREAYISAYGQGQYRKFAVITGYEVYIKRAEMSGRLNGWNTKIEACKSVRLNGKNTEYVNDVKAVVTIYRKDFDNPFIHEVKLSEYIGTKKDGTPTQFWQKMPETMIKKVAISQGFRMCFNEILGGMPYTKEEMQDFEVIPQKEEGTVTVEKPKAVESKHSQENTKLELKKDTPEFIKTVEWLKKSDANTFETLEKNYILSDDVKTALIDEVGI